MKSFHTLVIVESPGKIDRLEAYLPKGYKVLSCNGHIRDLPKKGLAIDLAHNFAPTYVISQEKEGVVSTLRQAAAQAKQVLLASDDDREGEAIAWHLKDSLGLSGDRTQRIVFREITRSAIQEAITHPRQINQDLVHSQQARRILDRMVGYLGSPVLWKISPHWSVGRVQSPAVRLIVEREREIYRFVTVSSYRVRGTFCVQGKEAWGAELAQGLPDHKAAQAFLAHCPQASYAIDSVERKEIKKLPQPPFSTSSLQQEASAKLGYSVTRTMTIAQQLYERGLISYMRTDSVHLSEEALQRAEQMIREQYGEAYHARRIYTGKKRAVKTQEAHEAIRPTDFNRLSIQEGAELQRLYTLIWQRTIASQMSAATFDRTVVKVAMSGVEAPLVARGEIMTFKGFLAAYQSSKQKQEADSAQVGLLPDLQVGDRLVLKEMEAKERFTRPPVRYTEATLVRELEAKGIGRPSTYAPIISTIQQRGYIVKTSREGSKRSYKRLVWSNGIFQTHDETELVGAEKSKLFPRDSAMIVSDFLKTQFSITAYDYTAKMEDELDRIAEGQASWQDMLKRFYAEFSPRVAQAEKVVREKIITKRLLGHDPATGEPVIARISFKQGALIQLGEGEGDKKPRFAALRSGQFFEQITLKQALALFVLPRQVGQFEEEEVSIHIGPYGPYAKHKGKFASLPKGCDPYSITLAEAIEVIEAKRKEAAQRVIKEFETPEGIVQICKGKWGPYIKAPGGNTKIPKEKNPELLDWEACQAIILQAPLRGKRPYKKSKKGKA